MLQSFFQNFDSEKTAQFSANRIKKLRKAMFEAGYDALLVPRTDIFQNEYLPASEERLAWLTGFTGSAGFLILTQEKCALFVDGRYTIQAQEEVDLVIITPVSLVEKKTHEWLSENLSQQANIAYQNSLFTNLSLKNFEKIAKDKNFNLIAIENDPFSLIWDDRPPLPQSIIKEHLLIYSGEEAQTKIKRLQAELIEQNVVALVISDCTNLNWLFNFRANDIKYLPIACGFAVVFAEKPPTIFLAENRMGKSLLGKLREIAKIISPTSDYGIDELWQELKPIAESQKTILLDEETAPIFLKNKIETASGDIKFGKDPTSLMKACKNKLELEGARIAHKKDGVAMVKFLHWLNKEILHRTITEIDAAIALENFRRENETIKDLSFPTISAAGANAALPHYRVKTDSNLELGNGLFLIDSGAQYIEGTTDITRTISIGEPNIEMKQAYTRVLKGMIAISKLIFPYGTNGAQIDAFARQFLWAAGQDYDHGTGHGVGSYLSVHEGPQRISKTGNCALQNGMVLSNEPGYYKEGAFGIRIENLIAVRKHPIKMDARKTGTREMLSFETLTLCPIDTKAIIMDLLDIQEKEWLNVYHKRVYDELSPELNEGTRYFLKIACSPL